VASPRKSVAGDVLDELRETNATVLALVAELRRQERHGITVTHTQAGMGHWGAVAVTACLFTTLMVIALAIVILPDIHDLKAWQNVFGRDIAAMKQQLNQSKP